MTNDNAKRLKDLTAQTRSVLDQWEAQALKTMTKYDDGSLTADDMVAAWTAGAKLAMTGFAALATSVLDLSEPSATAELIASDPFPVKRTTKFKNSPVSLEMDGPLTSVVGNAEIPADEVSFRPGANIGATVPEFRIEVSTVGRKAGRYEGKVRISDGKQKPNTVEVFIELK